MKIISLSLILIGFSASVFAATSDISAVSASHAIQIASVNELEDDAPWFTLQQAFCASFSEQLPSIGGSVMPVKVHVRDAVEAADELRSGTCDAVMVMADFLPVSLRSKAFITVKAVSKYGTPVRTFHFVVRKDDPALVSTLLPAFERATTSSTFHASIGRVADSRAVARN